MAAPPGQELRQCLSPASGSRAHTFMRFLHVGGDSVVEMAPHCAWGKRPTSRAKALLNSIDFCLEFSSPTSGIGNPYLTCLTQKLLFENVKTCYFWDTLISPARHHGEDQPLVEMGPQPQ